MTITLVQSEADVAGILALQQQNLPRNFPPDVQTDQGFVTVEHRPDVLLRLAGGAEAVRDQLKAVNVAGMSVGRTIIQLLLAKIYQGKALKPESRDLLPGVMERCQSGAARLRGFLPPGTTLAHKTGSLGATATDDIGYITLPDNAGHVAIAVFVGLSTQHTAEREQIIAHVARAMYDYFLFQ